MKSDSTLQDCLHIAKLTKGTVHVEKLGQNFLANVEKHDQSVDAVNLGKFREQSHSQSQGGPKGNQGGKGGKKSCGNCGTNHLVGVQPMEKTVFSASKKDISVPTVDPAGTTNSMVVHPQEDLDVNMKWNKMTMVMIGHFP